MHVKQNIKFFGFNVCVFAAVIIGVCSTWYFEDVFSYHQWKQLFTQNNCLHKTTVHTKQLFTQNNCLRKTTVYTKQLFTQNNCYTKQLFTQNNCSHKTTVHTKQLFTQNNCSHKTTVHTKQLNNFWTWNNSM